MAANSSTPEHALASMASVPVVQEELIVGKERVETGRVRIAKQVREELHTVDVPVVREEIDIERVPVNAPVEAMPSVRHEGDTMVIPVVREEVVLQKRLVLVEEIRVTRKQSTARHTQDVPLRREELVVERLPTGPEVRD